MPDSNPSIRSKQLALLSAVIAFALSWLYPVWPMEQLLHSSLTVVALAVIWHFARQRWLSAGSVWLLALFIALHCTASHWLYSSVPYDQWSQALFGISIDDLFGWRRNQFDRLVHLMYGICLIPALCDGLRHRYPLNARHGFWLAVGLIMVSSLIYEWLEWLIALLLSPEQAEAYNGQQGDIWDAHKDMLLATIGALLWWPRYGWRRPAD